MSALPDTTRLLLAVARALHATGYERTTHIANHTALEHHHQHDTHHHVTFEYPPETLPGQTKLTVRHGGQQITFDGINNVRDAVTVLAMLGVVGTCRQCDLPIEPDAVECQACAVTTDLIAYDAAVDHADYGRHSAHEAA